MRIHSGTFLTQQEQSTTFTRIHDGLRSVVHSYGRRTEYQSRKVRHKPPRRFLALPLSDHHQFVHTPQVIDRLFIMVTHMTTDVLGSITYNGFARGFGPTPPYAAPGTWVPPPSSYFSARGPSLFVPMGPPPPITFAPMGPAPQIGSYT